MNVDTASLYYLEGDQWSLIGRKDMTGPELMLELYWMLRVKGDPGPNGRAAANRRERGETVAWNDQFSDLTVSAGTGIAIVRIFGCDGKPVVHPDLPLASGISAAQRRHTNPTLPSIDLRAPQDGLTFNFVLDKIIKDTSESAGPSRVAVSRCSARRFRKLALILTRHSRDPLEAGEEAITSIVLRPLPSEQNDFRDMLLTTHHPALAKELDAAWQLQSRSALPCNNNDLYMSESGYCDPTLPGYSGGSYDGKDLRTPDNHAPQSLDEMKTSEHAAQSVTTEPPGEDEDGDASSQRQPQELTEGTGKRWDKLKNESGLQGWYGAKRS